MTHSEKGKKVEFTSKSMTIFDMEDNSMVVVDEIDHQTRLYTFSKFVAKFDSTLLLTHANDESGLFHERFGL